MENNLITAITNNLGNKKEDVILSASCPNCANRLEFSKNDESVFCYCCDTSFLTEQLINKPVDTKEAGTPTLSSFLSAAQLVDSADGALVYLENFFANTNWDNYYERLDVLLPEIEEMVEKAKIKFGASPAAWRLDFINVTTLLNKKFEGLSVMGAKMAGLYVEQDVANILPTFDLYKEIAENLYEKKDAYITRINNDIAFAEKLDIDADTLGKMKADAKDIIAKLEAFEKVKKPSDVAEIVKIKADIDEAKVKEFAEKGIIVTDLYDRACEMSKNPIADKNEYLRIFESIRGYSDTDERIDAINRYFNYDEYITFGGRHFTYKIESKAPVFEPTTGEEKKKAKEKEKAKKKAKRKHQEYYDAEEEFVGSVLSLYEVIDGKAEREPILENITKIIAVYANRIYYIKLDSAICYFDIESKRHYDLDTGKVGDYKYDSKDIFFNKTNTAFYIPKKLPIEITKAGCKKIFGKKDLAVDMTNNYSMLKISLVSDYAGVAIPRMIDITGFYGDNIFYKLAEEPPKLDRKARKAKLKAIAKAKAEAAKVGLPYEEEPIKTTDRAYNVEKIEDKQVLNDECYVRCVSGNYVIYTKFAPNKFNQDLYIYDLDNDVDLLIENNIYDYFDLVKDRIYYTVGNDQYRPLFSNNFTGTDRIEIMQNVKHVIGIRAGWMYVVKGTGRNAVLIKISNDGKDKLIICTQFKRHIKITDSYIYYLDSDNSLRVVRSDGKDNTLISSNISADSVIVDNDYIYYLREEKVDEDETQSSLYRMDLEGHNVRKLVFNVSSFKNYDENTLIIKKRDRGYFEITIPTNRKGRIRKERNFYDLEHFCTFDKSSSAMDTVYTLGLPGENEYEFKKGCFGKKVSLYSSYKRIPNPTKVKVLGMTKIGSVLKEQAKKKGVGINTLKKS